MKLAGLSVSRDNLDATFIPLVSSNTSINNTSIKERNFAIRRNSNKDNNIMTPAIEIQSNGNTYELMDNFLKMMLVQIKNQDPTNPMDNNQLATQMTQMQIALGIEKLNSTMLKMGNTLNKVQAVNLSNWIGRTVFIIGKPSVSLKGQSTYGFEVPNGADEVRVTFTDDQGNTYTQEYKNVKPGVYKLDFCNAKTIPPIVFNPIDYRNNQYYDINIEVKNKNENRPIVNALKAAKVENIFFNNGIPKLSLGINGIINLKDIILVE